MFASTTPRRPALALVCALLALLATLALAAPAASLSRRDPSYEYSRAPPAASPTTGFYPGALAPTPTAASAVTVTVTVTPTPTLIPRQAAVLMRRTTTIVRNGRTYRIVRTATSTVPSQPRPTSLTPPRQVDAPPPSNAAIPYGGPSGRPFDVSTAMVAAVNAVRLMNGVMSPLQANAQLAASCVRHAVDMARSSSMSHTGSDGSNPAVRAQQAGYNWRYISENVAAGQTSLVQVMESWMNSSGHRSNILSRSIRDMAAAVAANSQGKYFWVQCFGSL